MYRYTGLWLVAFLLMDSALTLTSAQKRVYAAVGGKVEMRPDTSGIAKPFSNILWKQGNDYVVEWVKKEQELLSYGIFKGRTILEKETGHLTISDVTKNDNGVYSVEISNEVRSMTYVVNVIEKVSKPSISSQPLVCSSSSSCSLVCDGDLPDARPIIYYDWKKDAGGWDIKMPENLLNITGMKRVKTFSCKISNPVSEADSEPYENPLYSDEPEGNGSGTPSSNTGLAVGISIAAIAVIGIVAFLEWKYKFIRGRIRPRPGNVENGDLPERGPLNPKTEDGVASPKPEGKTEDGEAAPKPEDGAAAPKPEDGAAAPKPEDGAAAPNPE